jgi:hypothetical protein
MSAADFTFLLKPKQKFRYDAGPYDRERHTPVYTIEVSAPSHVRQLLMIRDSLIETADGYLWIWDIENGSDSLLPAFFTVKKDGQPVARLEHMARL